MNAVIHWIRSNPIFFTLVVWPILTAVFSAVTSKPTEEDFQKRPRWAAFKSFVSKFGVDSPRTLRAIYTLLTGSPYPDTLPPATPKSDVPGDRPDDTN